MSKKITTIILSAIILLALLVVTKIIKGTFEEKSTYSQELSSFITDDQKLEDQEQKEMEVKIAQEKIQRQKERDAIKVEDNSKYPQAETAIKEGTGLVAALLNASPDAPYNWVEVEEDGVKTKIAIITGYIYSYTYKDLGLRISTPPLYEPYFFEKTTKPLITRNGNIIYNISYGNEIIGSDYIEVFFKEPNKSFEDEIKENQLPVGAIFSTGIATDHPMSSHIKGFMEIDIISVDGNVYGGTDKQLPSNMRGISFYIDPKKPDRYYKFSYGDCAPGPCSIFGDIEFF